MSNTERLTPYTETVIGDPNQHLRDLEKLVRELTPDAERFRHLKTLAYVAVQPHHSYLPKSQRTGWTIKFVCGNDESFEAAIDADAARAKEPKCP